MRAAALDVDFWVRSEQDERALLDGCYVEPEDGQRVLDFMQTWCVQSTGQWGGKPFVAVQWQRDDIIMPFWSWKRANGTRRFRRVRIWVPKKNGKSTLCSVVVIVLAMFDNEPGAHVYTAAVDAGQARIVFDEAVNMVKASPMLSERLRPVDSRRTIYHAESKSFIKALASDSDSAEGLKAHGVICDEIHAWKNRKMRGALEHGGRSRRQPSDWVISTAGFDEETVGFEEYEYSKAIKDDDIKDDYTTLVHISEAPDDADISLEATWKGCNPSWGIILDPDDFRADYNKAARSPGGEADFRRRSLNQWTQGQNPAIRIVDWDKCKPRRTFDELIAAPGIGGLDLAPLHDFSSFCIVFPDGDAPDPTDEKAEDRRSFDALWWYWIPEGSMTERKPEEQVRIRDWAKRGFVTILDDDVVDPRKIRVDIVEILKKFPGVMEVVYDPHMAQAMAIELQEAVDELDGRNEDFMIMCPQTCAHLNEPCCALERLVASGDLHHGRNPISRQHARNLSFKTNSDGLKRPAKQRGGGKRGDKKKHVDGMTALINALKRGLVFVPEPELYGDGMTFLDY